jgi:hypothetical protein
VENSETDMVEAVRTWIALEPVAGPEGVTLERLIQVLAKS